MIRLASPLRQGLKTVGAWPSHNSSMFLFSMGCCMQGPQRPFLVVELKIFFSAYAREEMFSYTFKSPRDKIHALSMSSGALKSQLKYKRGRAIKPCTNPSPLHGLDM